MRKLRVLRGKLAELLAGTQSGDFVQIVLTDDTPQIDAMKRLRDLYPFACRIDYERDERPQSSLGVQLDQKALLADPVSLISAFLAQTRGEITRLDETPLIADALTAIAHSQDTA